MGLVAEDFYTAFERGSNKEISGQEVQMALWLAVQVLTDENQGLEARLGAVKRAAGIRSGSDTFSFGILNPWFLFSGLVVRRLVTPVRWTHCGDKG